MLMNFIRMCNNGSFRPFMEGTGHLAGREEKYARCTLLAG